MKKARAGKRYFEARGRRFASLGLPMSVKAIEARGWPQWARQAWIRGWIMQPSPRQQTDRMVSSFERGAAARGVSLRTEVSDFLDGIGAQL